ncbi:MAG: glycosyltransferase, partial [Candidatus Omnitrophota bacterium]
YLKPDTQIYSINSFHYTNPILERIINRTYNGIIKRTPEVWEYLYDNPRVVKNTKALKDMMHRYNGSKMKNLINDLKPDVVACTQAFPCGMIADYKVTHNSSLPLIGVLTDFYPHSYWIYDSVDLYAVASDDARDRLISNGVSSEKIKVTGVPIDIKFNIRCDKVRSRMSLGLDPYKKTVLIMGGSGGLGPIKKVVHSLDRINSDIQMIVVSGTNSRLNAYLTRRAGRMNKKVFVIGYAENIDELMDMSDLIITKPGGLTASEALAKHVPIIIINPIPGQEAKNTEFLLQNGAAVRAKTEEDLAILVDNLCVAKAKLEDMKKAIENIARPSSAIDIAKTLLEI